MNDYLKSKITCYDSKKKKLESSRTVSDLPFLPLPSLFAIRNSKPKIQTLTEKKKKIIQILKLNCSNAE